MFTQVALEGQFLNADESPATGTVCARLNGQIRNQPSVVGPSTVCGLLDGAGRIIGQDQLALLLVATDDSTTLPEGVTYTLTLSLDGEPPVEFDTALPHNPSSFGASGAKVVDGLATTVEGQPLVTLVTVVASETMVGATITGTNISGTVESVDTDANTLTLSANATATGVDPTLTIAGGCVSFVALQQNAQS